VLADGAGSPVDVGVDTLLLGAVVFFAWIGVARVRNRAFRALPLPLGWASIALAGAALVSAFVLPLVIRPDISTVRPSSNATISITTPAAGELFHGNPASVPVEIGLRGGRIVPFTSTKLLPDTGHIHVYLDGDLVAMTTGLSRRIDVLPGRHTLTAEFVAVDHAPWNPRIQASVRFDVEP
jgi:hypothetical protein